MRDVAATNDFLLHEFRAWVARCDEATGDPVAVRRFFAKAIQARRGNFTGVWQGSRDDLIHLLAVCSDHFLGGPSIEALNAVLECDPWQIRQVPNLLTLALLSPAT